MTSPLAPLPGQTLLGATHDVGGRWVFCRPSPELAMFRALAFRDPVLLGSGVFSHPVETLASAPELEVWRHRDPCAHMR